MNRSRQVPVQVLEKEPVKESGSPSSTKLVISDDEAYENGDTFF